MKTTKNIFNSNLEKNRLYLCLKFSGVCLINLFFLDYFMSGNKKKYKKHANI